MAGSNVDDDIAKKIKMKLSPTALPPHQNILPA
jgi:hypothetical protein